MMSFSFGARARELAVGVSRDVDGDYGRRLLVRAPIIASSRAVVAVLAVRGVAREVRPTTGDRRAKILNWLEKLGKVPRFISKA